MYLKKCIEVASALKKKSIYITKLKSQVIRAEHQFFLLHEHFRGLLAPLGHRDNLLDLSTCGLTYAQMSTLMRDQTSLLNIWFPLLIYAACLTYHWKMYHKKYSWQLYKVLLCTLAWPQGFHRQQNTVYVMLYDYNRGNEVFLLERVNTNNI